MKPPFRGNQRAGSIGHFVAGRVHVLGAAFIVALSLSHRPAMAQEHAGSEPFDGDVETLLIDYCYDCHGDGISKGGIALDELLTVAPASHAGEWQKAWKIVRHEFMPPAGKDRPTDAERRAITQWIEQNALGVDYDNPDPGRVTIRRLNRVEYEYTVRDLFDAAANDAATADDRSLAAMNIRDRLPPDDTAFGFDNIGDFQSLSPALLDKYFDLAAQIVDRAIVQDGPRLPELHLGRDIVATRAEDSNRVDHAAGFELEHAGTYRVDIEFRLGGWQEFGGSYDFRVSVDDFGVIRDVLDVGGNATQTYSTELELAAGRHQLLLMTDAVRPDNRGQLNHLELRPKLVVTGPIGAGVYEYPETHRRVFFDGEAPDDAEKRWDYARRVLRRVADRAFRRPVDEATLDRLVEIAMRHPSFERGIGQALTGILVSPRFLFRAETQPNPDDPASVHAIDEYALASRLSYLLWLSLPDDELRDLAARGELRANLRPQVERMLADPKSARFFEDFAGQWLRTRNVLMTAITGGERIDPVRPAMKRETELLFEHVARNGLDLIELVTADYTFVNRELAAFYGLPEPASEGFQRVDLPADTHRGGILTHGSFLVSTSNPNRTSPVKRGLFVLENLLGTQPPPPPPNVPPLEEPPRRRRRGQPRQRVSIVAQLAAHRENQACAACHAHFDPLGIVLERFDRFGSWQDDGNIVTKETTVTGETLTGVDDLRELIGSSRDKFYRCVAEKLMTYALGRGLEPYDAMTVDRITDRMMAEGGRFSTLLLAVIESPAFQLRRGDDGMIREAQGVAIPEPPPPDQRRPRFRFRPQQQQRLQRPRPDDDESENAETPNREQDTP